MDPRLIVEIRWGKLAGTKVAVQPGGKLRVGRTERANLVVALDGKMSAEHFEIRWEGGKATARDLGSIEGTKLGGRPLAGGEGEALRHGGWIQAGTTHFLVYVEGMTPPGEVWFESEEQVQRARRRQRAAESALSDLQEIAGREPLYAVLDAARDDRILELLREHVEPHRSLYEGAEGETLEEVAPYLVGPMQGDSGLLESLVQEGWGKRWGIWFTSAERFRDVRQHWRRFLMVDLDETEESVYFRFYDPAVMKIFLEQAGALQYSQILRCTGAILVEVPDQDKLTAYSSASTPGRVAASVAPEAFTRGKES